MGSWQTSPSSGPPEQDSWLRRLGHASFSPRRIAFSYLLATCLCLAILAARLGFGYGPGDPPMLVLYMIPVIASAYGGGLFPGLYCTSLAGALSAFFLLQPIYDLAVSSMDNILNLSAMILTGLVISILVDLMHRLRGRVEQSLDRYRIVADNTYAWESWTDPDGAPVYQSPSCRRITGHDALEFISDPALLGRIVHPADKDLFQSHRHGVVQDKAPGTLQFRIVRPDGEMRWVEHFCQPVFGRGGEYLGVRASNNDITDRKRMEDVMVQTEKMLTVGGLAAGMAHEINNPLGGILQNLQNVKRRLNAELPGNIAAAQEVGCDLQSIRGYLEARHVLGFLDAIEASGKKAAAIVSEMLEFSRKNEGAVACARVNEMLESSIDLCGADGDTKRKCDYSGVVMERQYDPADPYVVCEPSQIKQVFLNLLRNATQALHQSVSPGSRPTLTLRTKDLGDRVRIEIEDNGPGMEPEVLKHAFDPFFSTRPPGMGAGLGLSVAYYLVANHKGSLTLESEPGHGTKAVVELPVGE